MLSRQVGRVVSFDENTWFTVYRFLNGGGFIMGFSRFVLLALLRLYCGVWFL